MIDVNRLFQRRRGLLFIKHLNGSVQHIHPLGGRLEIKRIGSLEDLGDSTLSDELKEVIPHGLKPNVDCLIAVLDKKVVHTSCVDYRHPSGVLLFGNFTSAEFRGKQINAAAMVFILRHLREQGYPTVYISCAKENMGSRASILRAGFTRANLWQRIAMHSHLAFVPQPVVSTRCLRTHVTGWRRIS